MSLIIHGTISNEKTQQGVADLIVEALDADLFVDDFLGSAQTDELGIYAIQCRERTEPWDKPDVYVRVKTRAGRLLYSTRNSVIEDVDGKTEINVALPPAVLEEAGLAAYQDPGPREKAFDDAGLFLNTWTFRSNCDLQSAVLAEIDNDLRDNSSILHLLKAYKQSLDNDAGTDNPVWRKLDALFDAGQTPGVLNGPHYGVTLGLYTPEASGPLAEFGNVLGMLWAGTLTEECPWVGKSFSPLPIDVVKQMTGASPESGQRHFLGINHFNRLQTRVLNTLGFHFLNFWMDLTPAPEQQQQEFGWEKNGGMFIATTADSVMAGADRPVLQLNYRHKSLANRVPNCWLIDELVQVAEGLYLGRLCYATRKLLRDYDMSADPRTYQYAHFGYFLLLDSHWREEARRLFPHLEIPENKQAADIPAATETYDAEKYTTFTFDPSCSEDSRSGLPAAVAKEASAFPTVLHYLKQCSTALEDTLSNQSVYFDHLAELFRCGRCPEGLDGFYYGALVSWRSEGLFDLFGLNTLNLLYTRICAPFSTWTGKRFDPISKQKLEEVTGGRLTDASGVFWGANTQSLKTMKERFVGRLMKLTNMPMQAASDEESRRFGYDLKNFFFIAGKAACLSPDMSSKQVIQLNYRWPELKTMVPDAYCIDELVEICRGLYLGRLMYATNIRVAYDPNAPASDYDYGLFGYFLLMDADWQRIRLRIGFDLENL